MEPQPVSRRTRLQQAIKDKAFSEEKKKRWFAARSNWRNRVSRDVKLEIVSDDSGGEEGSIITNIVKKKLIVENNKNLGGLNNKQQDNDHDSDKQTKVDAKEIARRCGNNEDSDDSLQIIGERWNPDCCYESHSSVASSDSDCETFTNRTVEDEVGHSRKTNKGVSNDTVSLRFDGLVLPIEPEKNARENDVIGRRTRSMRKKSSEKGSVRKRGRPFKTASVAIVSEPEKNPDPEICSLPEDGKGGAIVVKKKRGRRRRKEITEKELSPEKEMQTVETNEVENIMINTILENGNAGLETCVASVSEASLPLKFNFRVHNSLSEKSEEEKETDELFCDLDFALRPCDVGYSISCSDEDEEGDNVISYEGTVVQAKLCRQGKHYLILEDEVGIRCKFCPFIKLEIRDVIPDFHYNPFGRPEK